MKSEIKIHDELFISEFNAIRHEKEHSNSSINSNEIEIDDTIDSSDVFVYGKEINDFHSLKKDYIFTLNVCATQELYKLIQQQNIIIEELKNRVSILENKI